MIRVVLDANVFASGALGYARQDSTPGAILRALEERRFSVVVSEHLVEETERTLASPYFAQRVLPEVNTVALRLLREFATHTELTTVVTDVASHPEDGPVLATAVSGKADFLVTGDRMLQRLGSYEGVAIVSPRDFLTLLDRREQDDAVVP